MSVRLIVMGTSWGGLSALETLLPDLPPTFAVPIAVVQHRHRHSEDLGSFLQRFSPLPVLEVEDKTALVPGRVFLAPADYHLLVESPRQAETACFSLSTEAPVQHARPSIDVLFESAADAYGEAVVGVVLTGASRDGAEGLRRIKAKGGWTIVQDPGTAESATMPTAAIAATEVDYVLPLTEIVPCLMKLCQPLLR